MKWKTFTLNVIFLAVSTLSFGQLSQKSMSAIRIDAQLTIDGNLDEDEWNLAEAATDFVQTEPVFENKPSQRTEVKILYNDRGVYVGSMMYDDEPEKILKELCMQ